MMEKFGIIAGVLMVFVMITALLTMLGMEIYSERSDPKVKVIDGHEFMVKGFRHTHLEHCKCKGE